MRSLSSSILAVTAILNPYNIKAFVPSSSRESTIRSHSTHLYHAKEGDSSRRDFLSTTLTTIATSTLILSPLPALADLSDGNALPQGAAQFSRVIKVRAQLASVAKRVAEQPDEIDKKEWDKIDDFLRTVYSAGNDMKVISKGIYDPTKKDKADADIKLLQNLVQAAQKPVSKKDNVGFGVIATKADGAFEDFFDQLRDVPDEL